MGPGGPMFVPPGGHPGNFMGPGGPMHGGTGRPFDFGPESVEPPDDDSLDEANTYKYKLFYFHSCISKSLSLSS